MGNMTAPTALVGSAAQCRHLRPTAPSRGLLPLLFSAMSRGVAAKTSSCSRRRQMGGASHRASSGRAKGMGPMRLMGPPPADAADADGPLMEVVAPSAFERGCCILFAEYCVALVLMNVA